jgi:NAD(P)-dependent dehydrogenase (short-subunit alcohol dehydrogenase family)
MNNPEANRFIWIIPLKRWSKLADLIVYRASDISSFMTGSAITIDGGWTAE